MKNQLTAIFERNTNKKTFPDNSMQPIFIKNDHVFLKNISFSHIQINDIIMVKKINTSFIHRVIFKTKDYLLTKGDNNLKHDEKVYPKQIIGKVFKGKRKKQTFNPNDIYFSQSLVYLEEVTKINRFLKKENIDYLFLKGIPLYLYIENKIPQYLYADCDILVKKTHFKKLKDILEKKGYKRINIPLSPIHELLKNKEIETSYCKLINNIPVVFDIHAEIVFMMTQIGELDMLYPQKLIDKKTTDFLRRKRMVKVENETFPFLASHDLLYYLSLHLFHHNFRGYSRYNLFDSVFKKTKINFKKLSNLIKKDKTENFVYPVFYFYKKYYNTKISNKFLNNISPKTSNKKWIENIDIFEDESQLKAGVNRFFYLFLLSPHPWRKKILIFSNISILASVLVVLGKQIRRKFVLFPNYLFQASHKF